MQLSATIPAEPLQGLDLHQGDLLRVVSIGSRILLVKMTEDSDDPAPTRGRASEWVKQARGMVQLGDGEAADDLRMAYYSKKYGLPGTQK